MALTAPRACHYAAGMLLFGFCSMPVQAATPEDGRRAYDAGHFTDAMGIWSELSKQGNAEAEFGVGLLYDLGNGTPEDPQAAFFWYKLAADADLPEAEFNVAAMYDSGRGVAQSSASAALWYAKAAAHGHHRAEYALGLLYADGDGVPRNPEAAAAWLHKAAQGGLPAAADRIRTLQADPTGRADKLTPVTLTSPARDVIFAPTGTNITVPLVWTAPAEAKPVHYEIQVRELGGPKMRTVLTASSTETATLVQLPANPNFYVWNVSTVARDGSRAPGDWGWFSIGPASQSGQSMASVHRTTPTDR